MKEYDTVVLVVPTLAAVPVGSQGVILMVFASPSEAYEVEFFDHENRSLGFHTMLREQIALLSCGLTD